MEYAEVDPGPDCHLHGIPDALPFEGYVIYEMDDGRRPNPEPLATQKKVETEFAREKLWVEKNQTREFYKWTDDLRMCPYIQRRFPLGGAGFSVDILIFTGPMETLSVRPTLDSLKADWKSIQEAREAYLKNA